MSQSLGDRLGTFAFIGILPLGLVHAIRQRSQRSRSEAGTDSERPACDDFEWKSSSSREVGLVCSRPLLQSAAMPGAAAAAVWCIAAPKGNMLAAAEAGLGRWFPLPWLPPPLLYPEEAGGVEAAVGFASGLDCGS